MGSGQPIVNASLTRSPAWILPSISLKANIAPPTHLEPHFHAGCPGTERAQTWVPHRTQQGPRQGRREGGKRSPRAGEGVCVCSLLQAACSGDPAGSTSALLPPRLKRWRRQTSWGGRQGRPEQQRTKWNPPSEKQNGSASTLLLRFSPALQEASWHLCWLEGGPGASRSCSAFASGCRSLQSRGVLCPNVTLTFPPTGKCQAAPASGKVGSHLNILRPLK